MADRIDFASSPQSVTGSVSGALAISVGWVSPLDTGSGSSVQSDLTAYFVEYGNNVTQAFSSVAVATSVFSTTLTSLVKGVNYVIRVRAQNHAGNGSVSSSVFVHAICECYWPHCSHPASFKCCSVLCTRPRDGE